MVKMSTIQNQNWCEKEKQYQQSVSLYQLIINVYLYQSTFFFFLIVKQDFFFFFQISFHTHLMDFFPVFDKKNLTVYSI